MTSEPSTEDENDLSVVLIAVGTTIGLLVIVAIVIIAIYFYFKRRKMRRNLASFNKSTRFKNRVLPGKFNTES